MRNALLARRRGGVCRLSSLLPATGRRTASSPSRHAIICSRKNHPRRLWRPRRRGMLRRRTQGTNNSTQRGGLRICPSSQYRFARMSEDITTSRAMASSPVTIQRMGAEERPTLLRGHPRQPPDVQTLVVQSRHVEHGKGRRTARHGGGAAAGTESRRAAGAAQGGCAPAAHRRWFWWFPVI